MGSLKNEKRCIGRKIVFIPRASVGTVSAGIFGGNEASSAGVTSDTKNSEIQGLNAVSQN